MGRGSRKHRVQSDTASRTWAPRCRGRGLLLEAHRPEPLVDVLVDVDARDAAVLAEVEDTSAGKAHGELAHTPASVDGQDHDHPIADGSGVLDAQAPAAELVIDVLCPTSGLPRARGRARRSPRRTGCAAPRRIAVTLDRLKAALAGVPEPDEGTCELYVLLGHSYVSNPSSTRSGAVDSSAVNGAVSRVRPGNARASDTLARREVARMAVSRSCAR